MWLSNFRGKRSEHLLHSISRHRDHVDPVRFEQQLWERYGETVAVLVLDSSGFSRVAASHGIVHRLSTLVAMRDLCASVCRDHDCQSLRFHADNLFAVFETVPVTIDTAMTIHSDLYRAGIMATQHERLRVSVGIGYGKMLYCGQHEGYFSNEMNFSSKLGEDVAIGDETLLTENAFREVPAGFRDQFKADSTRISGVDLNYFRHRFIPD